MNYELNELKRSREAEQAESEHENIELWREIKAAEEELEKLKEGIKAKSLYAILRGADLIKEFSFRGNSSNRNPPNHETAKISSKAFQVPDLLGFIDDWKTSTSKDPMLEEHFSQLITKFINDNNITTDLSVPVKSPKCYNGASVAYYVNLLLDDVTTICNAIVSMIPCTNASGTPHLYVRHMMSIFSNSCDHAVVFDITSNVPIFCVATETYFDKELHVDEKNRLFGQCLDQLNAMRLLGQQRPFGALTCFNETYLTSVDLNAGWDVLPTLERFLSPFQVDEQANTLAEERNTSKEGFVQEGVRRIVRSESFFDHKCLVSAFVTVILHSLKVKCAPKLFQKYTEGALVNDYCLKMEKHSYQWGTLTTTCRGPYRRPGRLSRHKKNLCLLHCIGTGVTSKAYYAMTEDGYDCVVKLYVQRDDDDDGALKSKKELARDSKKHVTNEVNHYNKIYEELKGYVWQEILYGMDCIIMPYFHPIDMQQSELPMIADRLQLFTKRNLAFQEWNQSWRNIGRFNGKLYLFDLGDLVTCTSQDGVETSASGHLESLTMKMNTSAQNQNYS